jgi:hypothetical protein
MITICPNHIQVVTDAGHNPIAKFAKADPDNMHYTITFVADPIFHLMSQEISPAAVYGSNTQLVNLLACFNDKTFKK